MKSTKILYWTFTGLICALMLFTSLPGIVPNDEAVKFYALLGYPAYIIPFLSVAKILGVAGILIPGYPRIREWAYAGLAFDLVGALFSQLVMAPDAGGIIFMVLSIAILMCSYFYAHKKERIGAGERAGTVVV